MKKTTWIFSFIVVLTMSHASFAEEQTITLRDGTVMKGELLQVVDGVYTIRSSSLGQTQIKAAQIATITNNSNIPSNPLNQTIPAPSTQGTTSNQMAQIQNTIMANPDMMADIQAIAADPEVLKLMSNPAIIQAATTKDVNALKNNPAAMKLMQNPKVQALMERLKNSSSQHDSNTNDR